jgi:hypothetical protein
MYDYLSPLTQSQNFYAAGDKLTTLVRPLIISAQKEILALAARRVKQKEELAKAETNRAAAFPTKSESVGQSLFNFGKAGYLHGGETKIKTELSVTDRLIKGHKEDFGVVLFDAFVYAEDKEGYLPTDRQIRNVYDTARGDMDVLEKQKKAKEEEIISLGGKRISDNTNNDISGMVQETTTTTTTTAIAPATTNTNNVTSYGATSGGLPQSATPSMFTTPQMHQPDPFMAPPQSATPSMFATPQMQQPPQDPFMVPPSVGGGSGDPTGFMDFNSSSNPAPSAGFSDNNTQEKRSSDLLLDF